MVMSLNRAYPNGESIVSAEHKAQKLSEPSDLLLPLSSSHGGGKREGVQEKDTYNPLQKTIFPPELSTEHCSSGSNSP